MRWVALHTFKALLREKIVFNVFGVTILLLFFGYLASQLVYGHQDRVMLDVGLMMNALSIFSVAIGIGARFLRQEIELKTIYLFLTRPITRTQFFTARYIGMSIFVIFNYLILTIILWGAVKLTLGEVSSAFFQSFFLTIFESLILLASSMMFSFWLRPALVFMVMMAMIFLGHNHQMIQLMQSGVSFLNYFTPDLGIFLMSERVYYAQSLTSVQMINATLYGTFWLFFFLLIGNAVFSRKNL